ncbi:hypothetical protein C1645_871377 [Glomus cerebriforme]|uniref:Uncharacterized protein n=1 Tax=Glomus cerebriforme TaxID=658196 RepID=A0A397TGL9_9GLOM|nr:hypothetical protein C1645_871377 [Glomus cerebriforme]
MTYLDLDEISLRKVKILINTYKRDSVFESQSLRGTLLDAYLTGCLKEGDSVKYEHMGKIYNGEFKTNNKKQCLIIADRDDPECESFTEFIQKVTNASQRPNENQYLKLKIKDLAWKDFCKKLLQYFLEDSNVRDIFFGSEFPEFNVKKLYVVVDNLPTVPLQNIRKFQIVYIVWGEFTEKVPRNLPPRKQLSLEIKKKFDNLLDSTLGIKFSMKHRNLNVISLGWKISKGFYTDTPVIVFYVVRKGVIPTSSEIFPRKICEIETDVREGFYNPCGIQDALYCQEYKASVSPGCSIGITTCNSRVGTLGVFVKDKNKSNDDIYLLSNDHVLRLKYDDETKSSIRQPAYNDYEGATKEKIEGEKNLLEKAQYIDKNKEEIEYRSENIEELKKKLKQNKKKTELGMFIKGKRGNYNINNKSYGVDAAIALVNNPDRKRYIYSKDFAIPDTIFKNQSSEPIKISGIKDVSLIVDSELVFKVGRTTGLTKGHIDDSLTTIFDGNFRIYEQQSSIFGEVFIEKVEIEEKFLFPHIRLDRQILVKREQGIFMEEGDSGCVWFNQEGEIIALGHGAFHVNNLDFIYGIGSPINAVLEVLEVELYLDE